MGSDITVLIVLYVALIYFLFGFFSFALPGIRSGTVLRRGKKYSFDTETKMFLFCVSFWIAGSFVFACFDTFMTIRFLK